MQPCMWSHITQMHPQRRQHCGLNAASVCYQQLSVAACTPVTGIFNVDNNLLWIRGSARAMTISTHHV